MSSRRGVVVALIAVGLMVAFLTRTAAGAGVCRDKDPINALWLLARSCKGGSGCYTHCGQSNSAGQFVVVKDFRWKKNRAYLIIPSIEMKGIESPEVFKEPFLNLWQYGWEASQECPGQSPAHTGLALNSECARTEDQLHIHISCVRAEVQACLAEKDRRGEIGSTLAHPSEVALGPFCNVYKVVKVKGLRGKDSPFKIIQHFPGVNDRNMDEQSIAVIGSARPHEYFVLDTSHHGTNPGGAEELLNQDCSDWIPPRANPASSCSCG